MPENLLRTKLYMPPLRPAHVTRPQLVALLNAGHAARLTLVSAPAGYGKSTLLADWARQSRSPVAWLSLDGGDNLPSRFWSYFAAALQTIPCLRQANVGAVLRNALTARRLPPIDELLTILINDLSSLPAPAALIIDDLHLVTDEQVHDGLQFLLEHLPPTANGLRLLLASRSDPPWPLARLRARGDLTEVRAADLRFAGADVGRYLNQAMALDLDPDAVVTLETRTEGWITGLQMAALSLTRHRQTAGEAGVNRFISSFSGENRFVLDYLVEEVLSQQPDEIQTFLLQTSIFERLSAPLCSAVLGDVDGRVILRQLEQDNLFLLPLDEERRWYRYHHLFAELMRRKLNQAFPSLVTTLHDRSSRWFEAHGLLDEAVRHAQAAGSAERAARLVARHGMGLIAASELVTLQTWLDGLPAATVWQHPWLCIFSAWVRYYAGPREETEQFLGAAEQALAASMPHAPGEPETEHIRGHVAALRAYLALQKGDFDATARQAEEALARLPVNDYARATSAIALAESRRGAGELTAWAAAYRHALTIARQSGNLPMAVSAATYLADQQVKQGLLHEAAAGYRETLRLATGADGSLLPAGGLPAIKLGDLLREWNDLPRAETLLADGIHLCRQWGHTDSLVIGYVARARVALARENPAAATAGLQHAADLVRRTAVDPWTAALVDSLRLRLWLADGDFAAARRWATAAGLHADGPFDFLRDLTHVNLLRLLVAAGSAAGGADTLAFAHTLAARLLAAAAAAGWVGKQVEILILDALACRALDKPAATRAALSHALRLARPGGYVRLFADEGPPLAELLAQIGADQSADSYVSTLLRACRQSAAPAPRPIPELHADAAPPFEALSARELEVLRLLTSSLSAAAIAGELTVAVSTARTHIRNIYAKLDVHSRAAAVERARRLGLL